LTFKGHGPDLFNFIKLQPGNKRNLHKNKKALKCGPETSLDGSEKASTQFQCDNYEGDATGRKTNHESCLFPERSHHITRARRCSVNCDK